MGTPGVEHAAETVGDKGKAGLSAKTVVGAVGAAAGAAIVANKMKSGGNETDVETTRLPVDRHDHDAGVRRGHRGGRPSDVDADATTPYPADSGTDTTYGMGSEATRDNEGMNR
jgi:hypothetical protein